jgi:hypothetical protein
MLVRFLIVILFLLSHCVNAQPKTDALLKSILAAEPDSLLQAVLNNPEVYRYQIIYTEINRDKKNKPSFKNYYYNYDSLQYFNPASTVKMPLAFLSLEKINILKDAGVNKYTAYAI